MLPNTSFYTINLNRFNKIQGGSMRTVKKNGFYANNNGNRMNVLMSNYLLFLHL